MKLHRAFACVLVFGIVTSGVAAQKRAGGGALNAVREADIKSDIFTLAGDAMRGREAGTLDELRASVTTIDASVVWVGTASEHELANIDLKGKIAAAQITAPPTGVNQTVSLAGRRYATAAVNRSGARRAQGPRTYAAPNACSFVSPARASCTHP